MIGGIRDLGFGSTGALWSGIPAINRIFSSSQRTVLSHVGGIATGLHLVGLDEAPVLVVADRAMSPSSYAWMASASLVFFPPDGAPEETGLTVGTIVRPLSPSPQLVEPIASCSGPGDAVWTLVREAASAAGPWSYFLRSNVPVGSIVERPVDPAWLFASASLATGNCRIAMAGAATVIVSSEKAQLRVTSLAPNRAPIVAKVTLGPRTVRGLRGIVAVAIASLRFDGLKLSIGLTIYRQDSVLGGVSHGAILRMRIGAQVTVDSGFGSRGLWISSVARYPHFVAAGEVYGDRLAGIQGSEAIVFGLDAKGRDLVPGFGSNGVTVHGLGGTLASAVATNDRNGFIYLFAERQTDSRTVGCRILLNTPFTPVPDGTVDANFGTNGTVTLAPGGTASRPCGVVAGNYRLFVGVTRRLQGLDCDQQPAVVALDPPNGAPDPSFGAGGLALLGSVGARGFVGDQVDFAADGAAVFLGPQFGISWTSALHFVRADGSLDRSTQPPLPPTGNDIHSIVRLADGSLLLAGRGNPARIAKVDPGGTLLDGSFGTGGLATVPDLFQMGNPPPPTMEIHLLGVRPDGRIAIACWAGPNYRPSVGLLTADGALDMSYAPASSTPGLCDLLLDRRFTVHPFLQPDGSLICAVEQERQLALLRVDPGGVVDPSFGMGIQFVPIGGALLNGIRVTESNAGSLPLRGVWPSGFARLGDKLYVVGTLTIGGGISGSGFGTTFFHPEYKALVVARWNEDGTRDTGFGNFGFQSAGFHPTKKDWAATGILRESATSLIAYGSATPIDTLTIVNPDGSTSTNNIPRAQQPTVFRIAHPGGIDFTFGQDGAAIIRMQEFAPSRFRAGTVLPSGRMRLAFFDNLLVETPTWPRPGTTFGGLCQVR